MKHTYSNISIDIQIIYWIWNTNNQRSIIQCKFKNIKNKVKHTLKSAHVLNRKSIEYIFYICEKTTNKFICAVIKIYI